MGSQDYRQIIRNTDFWWIPPNTTAYVWWGWSRHSQMDCGERDPKPRILSGKVTNNHCLMQRDPKLMIKRMHASLVYRSFINYGSEFARSTNKSYSCVFEWELYGQNELAPQVNVWFVMKINSVESIQKFTCKAELAQFAIKNNSREFYISKCYKQSRPHLIRAKKPTCLRYNDLLTEPVSSNSQSNGLMQLHNKECLWTAKFTW